VNSELNYLIINILSLDIQLNNVVIARHYCPLQRGHLTEMTLQSDEVIQNHPVTTPRVISSEAKQSFCLRRRLSLQKTRRV
jgi:hypothetical protein